jgi:CheY-like chemotaxis protein
MPLPRARRRAAPAEVPVPTAPAVLIVEDDPFIRRIEARIVIGLGLRVESCADMAEGLQRAAEGGWDLLLLDLNLPDAFGESLLLNFLTLPALLQTPVLCVSGDEHAGEWLPRWAELRPGLGLLPKPFSRPQLEERLRAALRLSAPQGCAA